MKKTPIKLTPVCKDYLWGGDRLIKEYGKKINSDKLAESWELSAHKDGESIVASGDLSGMKLSEYIALAGRDILGEKAQKYDYFPLLIKLIDAKSDLSVQVHPDDEYALSHEGEYGKTETWYIVDCDPDAYLYYGFEQNLSKEEYKNAIEGGKLCDILRKVKVSRGDVFFIPAGTVHAIGAGILICEVQQNSNTTYRVFDYNRRDKDGNLRPLHIEKAIEVSSLTRSPELTPIDDGDDVLLVNCQYFEVRRLKFSGEGTIITDKSSFVSLIVTEGNGRLTYEGGCLEFARGDSIFLPACDEKYEISGNCEIIRSKVN